MWKLVPGAALRIHQVPEDESFFHARHIISQIAASGLDEGLILIRATERIQRLVAQSGVKAVVFGHLFPGVSGLHSVTMDQAKAGELAVKACLAQKCRQLVVVMRASWRMGDADFFAAILRHAGAAGLRADQIQLLVADEDPAACSDQIRGILASSPAGRIGLVCRHSAFARAAQQHKGDFHLVSAAADTDGKQLKACDEILATLSREKIGEMLLQQLALPAADGLAPLVIPVRLN
jgi:DNA-binding LacI/PurR family transcriptional regulator